MTATGEIGQKQHTVTPEGRSYECPFCEASYDSEILARVHISRSTDDKHRTYNGFMPEAQVVVVDSDGEVVDRIEGRTPKDFDLSKLADDDFPDTFTLRERVALRVAAEHHHEGTYSELQRIVNEELRDRYHDPLPYNRTRELLKQYYEPQTMSAATTSPLTEGGEQLDELTTIRQGVILAILNNPEMTQKEIAEEIDASYSYVRRIASDYSEFIDELRGQAEAEGGIEALMQSELSAGSIAILRDEGILDTFDIGIEEEEKELADLTPRQQALIIARVIHPNVSTETISERVGTSKTYPNQVFNEYGYLITELQEQLQAADDPEAVLLEHLDVDSISTLMTEGLLDDVDVDFKSAVKEYMGEDASQEVFDQPINAQSEFMQAAPDIFGEEDETEAEQDQITWSREEDETEEPSASDQTEVSETKETEVSESLAEGDLHEQVRQLRDQVQFFKRATGAESDEAHRLASVIEEELDAML